MKKKDLVIRIIFVSTFLVVSTFMFYVPKSKQLLGAMSFLNNLDRLELNEVTKSIELSKKYPVSDKVGMNGNDTVFIVKNNNNSDTKYNIKIENKENDENIQYLNLKNIKYVYKINDGEYSDIKTINEDGILDVSLIEKNSENKYSFKFWISEDSSNEVYGSVFAASISLNNM